MLQKIICIDDDPIALLLSKLVISKSNLTSKIVTFANGLEGINYLTKEDIIAEHKSSDEPLLILLDLNMPVMDGWEFLDQFNKKLQDIYTNTRIILLSSSIDPHDIQKSRTFETVMDFLPKPLTRDVLNTIISKI